MISVIVFAFLLQIEPLVAQGDSAYVDLNYERAESLYSDALNASPNNADMLWRMSRLLICIADIAPKERKEQVYRNAESFARRCIANNDTNSAGYTWLAAALGNIAMFEGGEQKCGLHATSSNLSYAQSN